MKFFFLFFLFLSGVSPLSAQIIEPDTIQLRTLSSQPVRGKDSLAATSAFPVLLVKKKLENSDIENPGVRYALQNLKQEKYTDTEVQEAIRVLVKYAENERLKKMVHYLKEYSESFVPRQEQAIRKIQEHITFDSIEFYKANQHLLSGDFEDYKNTDLQTFLSYVRNDSNYLWLRDANRDSVLVEVMNITENTLRFWMNNGRTSFHRFWANTKAGDTIGTWIEVIPDANRLKIYVDEDVYQVPTPQKKMPEKKEVIANPIPKEWFALRPMKPGELKRRYWTYYSEVEINMSQGKVANWANGGENSLSLLSNLRYYWNYNKNNTSWENRMHYRFGFMKTGEEDIRKNEDWLELNSKLGQKAFKHWYYTTQFNAQTQLFNSYDYPKDADRILVANFMSPGYFTLSLGMDYKPNDNFSLVLSPIAGKWNFVRDTSKVDAQRYGIEEGKRSKREAGVQLNVYSKIVNIFKIMEITNEVKLFMSYENKDKYLNKGTENEEKKRIPVTANWKMSINFKINYFMSASVYTETNYDENYSRKLQFKENLNLGVRFRF